MKTVPRVQKIWSGHKSVADRMTDRHTYKMDVHTLDTSTAVFSEVRLVQYGVMGLKSACGVNLVRFTPKICNVHGPLGTSEHPSCKFVRSEVSYVNFPLQIYVNPKKLTPQAPFNPITPSYPNLTKQGGKDCKTPLCPRWLPEMMDGQTDRQGAFL